MKMPVKRWLLSNPNESNRPESSINFRAFLSHLRHAPHPSFPYYFYLVLWPDHPRNLYAASELIDATHLLLLHYPVYNRSPKPITPK